METDAFLTKRIYRFVGFLCLPLSFTDFRTIFNVHFPLNTFIHIIKEWYMVDVLKRGLSLLDCHFFVFFDFHLALLLSSRCVRFDVCSGFFFSIVCSFVRSLCHCCQISNACSICLIPVDEFAEIINLCWVQCTLIWKHLSNSFKLKSIMEPQIIGETSFEVK